MHLAARLGMEGAQCTAALKLKEKEGALNLDAAYNLATEAYHACLLYTSLFTLCIIFSTGFSYGLTPVVGGFYGNRRFAEAGQALSLIHISSTCCERGNADSSHRHQAST